MEQEQLEAINQKLDAILEHLQGRKVEVDKRFENLESRIEAMENQCRIGPRE